MDQVLPKSNYAPQQRFSKTLLVLFEPVFSSEGHLTNLQLTWTNTYAREALHRAEVALSTGALLTSAIAHPDFFPSVDKWFEGLQQQGMALIPVAKLGQEVLELHITAAATVYLGELVMAEHPVLPVNSKVDGIAPLATLDNPIKTALATLGVGFWELDIQHDLIFWNKQTSQIMGYSPSAPLRFNDFLSFVHPDDQELVQYVRQSTKPRNLTVRIITRNGQIYYLENWIMPVELDGQVRLMGIIQDRTEQVVAQKAGRESQDAYRQLVNNLKQVVFQTDLNGLWTFLNPAWEEITGFEVAESIGQPFIDYVYPDDRQRNREYFEPLVNRTKTYCRHEIRYLHKTDGFRWIEVFARLTLDEQGQPKGTTGTLTDITESRNTQEALRESEQRFREFADNVDSLFWIRELDPPRFTYVNKIYERITGFSREVIYQNPDIAQDGVRAEDRSQVLQIVKTTTAPDNSFIFRANVAQGERTYEARVFNVNDDSGKPIRRIGIANDITHQVEKKELLEKALQREQELNKLKSLFVSMASHQFRTPLMVIQSSTDLINLFIKSAPPDNQAAVHQQIYKISKEVTRITGLLDNLLLLGKLESGKIDIKPEAVRPEEFCRQVVEEYFSNRSDGRRVELKSLVSDNLIWLDPALMTQVLINLLTNAFNYSKQNVSLKLYAENGLTNLDITDKGIGIPAGDLPHLFETFYRASNATGVQGTGLGLAIALKFIELHRGLLTVKSKVGKGTTFTISLPDLQPEQVAQ